MVEQLGDGLRNAVWRSGDRIIREGPLPRAEAHHVLRLLEAAGWPGSPRLLASGPPEELTYIDGIVPGRGEVPAYAISGEAVTRLGQLLREFHDITAAAARERGHEVICHNDLAPANTVFDERTRLPVAFIDWDLAAPGARLEDLGHAAWQWFSLGPSADVPTARRGIAQLAHAYGQVAPARILDAAIRWQLATADGIEAGAGEDASLAALVRDEVPARCREAAAWTAINAIPLAGQASEP